MTTLPALFEIAHLNIEKRPKRYANKEGIGCEFQKLVYGDGAWLQEAIKVIVCIICAWWGSNV